MGGSAGNEKNKWTKNEAEELNVSKINRTGKRTPRPPLGDEALEHLNSRSFSATADTSFATPRVPQPHGEAPRGVPSGANINKQKYKHVYGTRCKR